MSLFHRDPPTKVEIPDVPTCECCDTVWDWTHNHHPGDYGMTYGDYFRWLEKKVSDLEAK